MKKNGLSAALLLGMALQLGTAAWADQTTVASSPNVIIPDDNLNGVVETIDLTTSIASIDDVTLTLDISGGYNGDYYAYLRHSDSSATGFAVLLNRVGETAATPYGSVVGGFDVVFSDSAAVNVHSASASSGVLTGTFQPDGRNISPFTAPGPLYATLPTALLNSFDGMDANGYWTLFIADVSPLGVGTLDDWSLTVTGNPSSAAVPDGGGTMPLLLVGCGLLLAASSFRFFPSKE